MEFIEFKGKTVDDAITEATIQFGVTSEELIYEVIDKGSTGILGFINTKPAIIRAKKKETFEDIILEFLEKASKIIVGKTAGFCYGVKRAVEGAENEIKNSKEPVYCLGEIVHNKQVVEELKKQGITRCM